MGRSFLTRKPKPYHKAALLSPEGKVSPLCAKKPRALNLAVALWTLIDKDVTCPRCVALLKREAAHG